MRSLLLGLSLVAVSAQAWAEPLRIEQRVAPACVAAASELEARVEGALGGPWANELEASVVVDAVEAGFRATIGLRDREQARGTTVIEAPSCEEAVEAAVVVLALAFGEVQGPEAMEPAAPLSAVPVPERAATPVSNRAPAPSTDRPGLLDTGSSPSSDSGRAMRLALVTGVDRGTLPEPTLTLAGALTRSFGGLELAAVARYGFPVAEETVETAFSELRRHDFVSLEVRGCGGRGQAVRFSACAGTEVGAVRASRALQGDERTEVDTDGVSPRLSGTLAALVAHRGGLVEPGLELAGAAVAFGHEAGAPRVSVRVAASAAIAF